MDFNSTGNVTGAHKAPIDNSTSKSSLMLGNTSLDSCDEYEIFEQLPDRSLSWRGLVRGLQNALVAVWLLADETGSECFAMDSSTSEIVIARTPLPGGKRIFQVAFSKAHLPVRAHRLHRKGHDVTSVAGGRAAQFVLRTHPPYDLFVIGHAAPEPVRRQIVRWVRARYPDTAIVTLNPNDLGLDDIVDQWTAIRKGDRLV